MQYVIFASIGAALLVLNYVLMRHAVRTEVDAVRSKIKILTEASAEASSSVPPSGPYRTIAPVPPEATPPVALPPKREVSLRDRSIVEQASTCGYDVECLNESLYQRRFYDNYPIMNFNGWYGVLNKGHAVCQHCGTNTLPIYVLGTSRSIHPGLKGFFCGHCGDGFTVHCDRRGNENKTGMNIREILYPKPVPETDRSIHEAPPN